MKSDSANPCRQRQAWRRHLRGQAMVEYLVASLVLMMLIGVSFAGERSMIDMFLEAVQTAFNKLSAFLSLPQ